MPMNLLLFGAPGSGKGSVSESLVRDFGLVHISTGNLIREEVEKGTPDGHKLAAFMNEGNLIPDEVIVKILVKRLHVGDAKRKGILLDGFPRTLSQAKSLNASGLRIDAMIFINVDPQLLEERCLYRRLDPVTGRIYNLKTDPPPAAILGRLLIRSDDTCEKLRRRMHIYMEQKDALMKHYKGKIIEVDGNPPLHVVYADIQKKLNSLRQKTTKSKL